MGRDSRPRLSQFIRRESLWTPKRCEGVARPLGSAFEGCSDDAVVCSKEFQIAARCSPHWSHLFVGSDLSFQSSLLGNGRPRLGFEGHFEVGIREAAPSARGSITCCVDA
jgi:hypothetical protein